MRFDVIIGNPPYQESDNHSGKGSAIPIYQYFVQLSKRLSPDIISLITPSVWFTGGKGLDKYRHEMINDRHLEFIRNFDTPKDVFPTANLRGGVNYFVWNKNYDNNIKGSKVETVHNGKIVEDEIRSITSNGIDIFISSNRSYNILVKLLENDNIVLDMNDSKMFSSIISARNPFNISTKQFLYSNDLTSEKYNNSIKVYGSKDNIKYINRNRILKHNNWINKRKVLTPFANNIGTDLNDNNLNTIITDKNSVASETFLVIDGDYDLKWEEALSISKYMKSRFVKFLISLAKSNQNGTRITYRFVPNQDFTNNSDINWRKSINDIDTELFNKYDLNNEEINFIRNKIN